MTMTPQQQATIDAMVEQVRERAASTDDLTFRAELELYAELLPAFLRWQLLKADDEALDGEAFFKAAIRGLADVGAHLLRNIADGDDTLDKIGPGAITVFAQHLQLQSMHAIPGLRMPAKGDRLDG